MILDPELEALAKCADALKDLDNEVRIRVIQYLINKYKLDSGHGPTTMSAHNNGGVVDWQNASSETKTDSAPTAQLLPAQVTSASAITPSTNAYPALRQVLLKQLPATEAEWILVYAFYSSDFGSKEFKRSDLIVKLDETNRRTMNRVKGMTNAVKAAIKNDWFTALNEEEFLVADEGIQFAKTILNRTVASKPRKYTKKSGKAADSDE